MCVKYLLVIGTVDVHPGQLHRHIWCCRLAYPSIVVSMIGKVLFVESWAVRVQRDLGVDIVACQSTVHGPGSGASP